MDQRDFLEILDDKQKKEVNIIDFKELDNYVSDFYLNNLLILHLNISSLRKHLDELIVILSRSKVKAHLVILSETRNFEDLSSVSIPGYECLYNESKINQNDGLIIYINNSIKFTSKITSVNIFNFLSIEFKLNDTTITIDSIYRLPSTNEDDFILSLDRHLGDTQKAKDKELKLFVGDINIDILSQTNRYTNDYLNCLYKYGYLSYINDYTRVTDDSKSCIDHVFVKGAINSGNLDLTPFIVKNNLSDHYTVALLIQTNTPKIIKETKFITNMDYTLIQNKLSHENWDEVTMMHDSESSTSLFINILHKIIQASTIKKQITNKQTKLKPWITQGIITAMIKRDQLKQKLNKDKHNTYLKTTYKYYRNKINSLIKNTKNNYYKQQLDKYTTDPKNTWKVIYELTDRTSNGKNNISHIKLNDKIITDDQEKANLFNSFFTNIGHDIASKISTDKEPLSGNSNRYTPSMFLHPVHDTSIIKYISSLKNTRSTGEDQISVQFLKRFHIYLLKPLKHIINTIFSTAVVPKCLKSATIVPIFKGGDQTDMTNYRPIALVSNISKIFEKALKEKLENFLVQNNIISKNQYGFQKNISTVDAIYQLTSDVNDNLHNKKKCLTVFLDLRKAFDTVNHQRMLDKLENIGIRGLPLALFRSYLSSRTQNIKLNKHVSEKMQVTIGVPQGTVLAPTLFLIYINDLCNLDINGKLTAFADDQAITFCGRSWEEAKNLAETGMEVIKNWLDNNYLSLNISKTKFINYSVYDKYAPDLSQIKVKTNFIESVDKTKYLGIVVDKNFKWQEHSLYLTKKIRKLIPIFYKLRGVLSKQLIMRIYNSLVESLLRYALVIWGGTYDMYLKQLHKATNYILRIILKKKKTFPSLDLYKDLQILNLYKLYALESTCFVHNNIKNYTFINHTYQTRGKQNLNLMTKKYNNTQQHNFIDYLGTKFYNQLNNCIKNIENKKRFRKQTTKFLLANDF